MIINRVKLHLPKNTYSIYRVKFTELYNNFTACRVIFTGNRFSVSRVNHDGYNSKNQIYRDIKTEQRWIYRVVDTAGFRHSTPEDAWVLFRTVVVHVQSPVLVALVCSTDATTGKLLEKERKYLNVHPKKKSHNCVESKIFFGHFHALKKNKLLNKDPKLTNFRYGKKISDSPKTKFCLEIRG